MQNYSPEMTRRATTVAAAAARLVLICLFSTTAHATTFGPPPTAYASRPAVAYPNQPQLGVAAPSPPPTLEQHVATIEGHLYSTPPPPGMVGPSPQHGLRMLYHLLSSTALPAAALARLLPAALHAGRSGDEATTTQALQLVPLLFRQSAGCELEAALLLQHLPLHLLRQPAAPASLRVGAARCLSELLSQPRAALVLHARFDCVAQLPDLWAEIVGALGSVPPQHPPGGGGGGGGGGRTPGAAEGWWRVQELAWRLRACEAPLLQRLHAPSAAAPEAWRRLHAARARKAARAASAALFARDPEAAVRIWKREGWWADPTAAAAAEEEAEAEEGSEAEAEAAERVAAALFSLPGLSPRKMGGYLSGPAPFRQAVLAAYMRRFRFGGLRIDEGLRLVFGALHMPGEAQKVDRIMGAFASALHRDAPAPFADADAAYVMAFSLMMLNTDLHNPAVRAKMSLEQFVDNNRGINGGHDLPPQYLAALYASVAAQEIVPPAEDDAADAKADADGADGGGPPSPHRLRYLRLRRSLEGEGEASEVGGEAGGDGGAEAEAAVCAALSPATVQLTDALLRTAHGV